MRRALADIGIGLVEGVIVAFAILLALAGWAWLMGQLAEGLIIGP